MTDLDRFDLKILRCLQEDARLSHVALSEKVALSPSQCSRRLTRLEAAGLIRGYAVQLDPDRLGLGVVALVSISLERHGESSAATFHEAVLGLPEVTECSLVTGDADYLLRVVAPNLKAFSRFVLESLMTLPGVANLRSSIVLEEIKSRAPLPLDLVASKGK